ncbi:MAG TPA: polynucleotide adenylyltransferase PcnB [Burkholderiaceae bacterium]|nr:polynucleotide adenylyltransferase PcnB [Burkholderiaceae bacterium]
MIRTFIDRFLKRRQTPSAAGASGLRREPKRYTAAELGINPAAIPSYATRVTRTLQEAGYKAYVVGGAVRDLLVGKLPKDFDVATNATPEQVHALFRRSRIIGRRFQIVHVGWGDQTVEVSTFRALAAPAPEEPATDADAGEQQARGHVHAEQPLGRRERRNAPVAQTRSVDESGRLLRDNIFGEQHEDATRRDFTINAMFYDPAAEIVLDYHDGVADCRAKRLRIIGDAATRFREDPVRMLRAVRFAAKLGFELDPATRAPIAQCADLMVGVPKARLFDEMLKLLFCGHAKAGIERMRAEGLHGGLMPLLDTVLDTADGQRFIEAALANTDARVQADKPVSPGFLFAALLWPQVRRVWKQREASGMPSIPALFAAADDVLTTQTERLAIQRRFVSDMKEIWALQPRFEKRMGRHPFRLLEQPRYRAGYDFLALRAQGGELDAELPDWWAAFAEADGDRREAMIVELAARPDAPAPAKKRRRRRKKAANATPVAGDAAENDATSATDDDDNAP